MELVAEQIAETITARVPLPPLPDPQFRTESLDISSRGDVFAMLDLPERQALYDPEFVSVRRIVAADGSAWRPSQQADVLLLGDSFTNIYSLESMGWGTGGGLAEQLSFVLRRPIDRLVQNDAGAYATRELLQRAGPERLAPKKVVVWQFAARELAFGDWKVLDLPR
jgi:alginate O-acetyltransferase complex protein AlgJ